MEFKVLYSTEDGRRSTITVDADNEKHALEVAKRKLESIEQYVVNVEKVVD